MRIYPIGVVAACFAFALSCFCANAKDYSRLGFDMLAAKAYNPEAPKDHSGKVVRDDRRYLEEFVLDSVLSLDGKPVEIGGYMMPISEKGQKVDEFLLMPNTGACCYGMIPAFNEFVYARSRQGVNLFDNIPIRVRGTLRVEEVWQNGFFSHLYFLEVDELLVGSGATPNEPEISW